MKKRPKRMAEWRQRLVPGLADPAASLRCRSRSPRHVQNKSEKKLCGSCRKEWEWQPGFKHCPGCGANLSLEAEVEVIGFKLEGETVLCNEDD